MDGGSLGAGSGSAPSPPELGEASPRPHSGSCCCGTSPRPSASKDSFHCLLISKIKAKIKIFPLYFFNSNFNLKIQIKNIFPHMY